MRPFHPLCAFATAAAAAAFLSSHTAQAEIPAANGAPGSSTGASPTRIEFRVSVVSGNDVREGGSGTVETLYNRAELVHSHTLAHGVALRYGLFWDRFDFGTAAAPIPGSLQTAAAILGADIGLSESFAFRVECRPGVYSDFQAVTADDLDAPLLLAARWLVGDHLELYCGVRLRLMSRYPVLPLGGLIIHFSNKLTLDLLYPEIKFEYRATPAFSWQLGIEFITGAFHTRLGELGDKDDGELAQTEVDYFESRPHVGVTWSPSDHLDLFLRAGVAMGRVLDYHEAGREVITGAGGFAELGLRTQF